MTTYYKSVGITGALEAIGYRGNGGKHDTSSSVNYLTGTLPSGVQNGDFLVAIVARTGGTGQPTDMQGWTEANHTHLGSSYYWGVWYKVASSEPSSYTWSFSYNGMSFCIVHAYTGVDPTTPIHAIGAVDYLTNNTILRAASVTTDAPGLHLVYAGVHFSNSSTKPTVPTSDWAEDNESTNGSTGCIGVCGHMTWSGSGATGNADATLSGSTAYKNAALFALHPATAPRAVAVARVRRTVKARRRSLAGVILRGRD